jgi:gliding motility-associated-like protein
LKAIATETGWDQAGERYILTLEVQHENALENYTGLALHVAQGVKNNTFGGYETSLNSVAMQSIDFNIHLFQVKITDLDVTPPKINQSTTSPGSLTITATYETALATANPPKLSFNPSLLADPSSGISETIASTGEGTPTDPSNPTEWKWVYDIDIPPASTFQALSHFTITGGEDALDATRKGQDRTAELPVDYVKPKLKSIYPLDEFNDKTQIYGFELQFNEKMDPTADISLTFDTQDAGYDPGNSKINAIFLAGTKVINWKNDSTCTITYNIAAPAIDPNDRYHHTVTVTSTGGADYAGNPKDVDTKTATVNVDQRTIGVKVEMAPVVIQRSTPYAIMKFTFGQEMDTTFTPTFKFTNKPTLHPNFPMVYKYAGSTATDSLLLLNPVDAGHWTPDRLNEYTIQFITPNASDAPRGWSFFNLGVTVGNAVKLNPREPLETLPNDSVFSVDYNLPSCKINFNKLLEGTNKGLIQRSDVGPESLMLTLTYDEKMDISINPQYEFVGLQNAGYIFQNAQIHWNDSTTCLIWFDVVAQEVTQETYIQIKGAESKGGLLQGLSSSTDPLIVDMRTIEVKSFDISTLNINCTNDSVLFTVYFNQQMHPREDSLFYFPGFHSPFLELKKIHWSIDRTSATATYYVNGSIPSNQNNIASHLIRNISNQYGRKYEGASNLDQRFEVHSTPPVLGAKSVKGPLCHDESTGEIDVSFTGAATYKIYKNGTLMDPLDYTLTGNAYSGLSAGSYQVKATGADQCYAVFDTTFINPDVLHYDAEITQHIENKGNKVVNGQIAVKVNGGTQPYTATLHKEGNPLLVWLTEEIDEDAILDIAESNTYILSVSDANSCGGSDTLLTVIDRRTPTLFTPEDGIYGPEIFMKGQKVEVFDRTGTLIHSGNDGWDGKYKGRPALPATYFYIVTYPDGFVKKGTIQLFKK